MRIRLLKFITSLVVFILFAPLVWGQYYNLGQDPASLKWRQINLPAFKLIFPTGFETQAQKLIPVLTDLYSTGSNSLNFKPAKTPFIFHNLNTVSNGVTVWAPRRVELYTCPPQDSYAQDWLSQLAIHEYRHVVQLDRTNQGFTKVLSWITGEQAASIVNGIFVPSWFMEGDAVCAETALSQSGRGRIPSFEMLLRAQVMQKGAYSYDKAALGSFKSFVPNQYSLGYTLVANVRRKYGYQAWVTALDEVARKPFLITPFNHGLKKATGCGKEKLYRMSMTDMDSLWKFQNSKTFRSDFKPITTNKKQKYINYKFPSFLNDTLVIAAQTSLDDITRFVIVSKHGEKQIATTPGFLSSETFSVFNTIELNQPSSSANPAKLLPEYKLAWTETINDIRWEQRNFSILRVYDSRSGKTRNLTKKCRFFSPSFSPDGQSFVAVNVDPFNRCSIIVLNAENGIVTDTLLSSDSDYYMTPAWDETGEKIAFTKLSGTGKSINVYNLKTHTVSEILLPTYTEISNPVFAVNYIVFNGSYSGIENIYAIDLSTYEIYQVTSAEFGASNARLSPDGKRIVYSNYTSDGYSLVEADFKPGTWNNLSDIVDYSPSLYKNLVKEEAGFVKSDEKLNLQYASQPYKKASHLFNFHSWAPAYINYMSEENGLGVSFMSQNELSTATTVIGYKYDLAENTGKATANFSWNGWYPVVELNSSYGGRAAFTGGDTSLRYTFNETIISGGFTLPLSFTGGDYYKGIRLQLHTSLKNISDNTSPLELKDKVTGTFHSLDYSIYSYRYIKQARKDIYPRWGQGLFMSYRHSPFGDNDLGSIVSITSRFYFPGFIRHQGLRIDLSWQKKNPGQYVYANQINLPRGYLNSNERTLTCFALNYKFPFAYPDFAIGPLVYFKRLKANLFYDGGIGETKGKSKSLQSTGIEITSDLHILRFVFPLDVGFRAGYLPLEKRYFTDFLFSVNLSN